MCRKTLVLLVALMLLAVVVTGCQAQSPQVNQGDQKASPSAPAYPTKAVTLITHSSPGGGGDIFIRALAKPLQDITGQPFVAQNITGGSGANALSFMAKAAPDGYNLLAVTPTHLMTPLKNTGIPKLVTEGGALVPMLTLGVPGSPTTAVLLGALMLHGLRPGPALFQQRADIVYALYVGLIIGALILLLLGLTAVRLFIRAVNAPKPALLTVILTLSLIGSYSVGNDMFSVWVMIIFSLLGYMMRRYEFPAAPMVLGIVLGFMVESSLRRALIISHGSWLIFFTRPISLIILTMAGVSIVVQLLREYSGRWRMTKPFKFTS